MDAWLPTVGVVLFLLGTRGLSELRIWWAHQTGRGSCRYCGHALTVRVGGLLRTPEGFFGVCSWCGREQPEALDFGDQLGRHNR